VSRGNTALTVKKLGITSLLQGSLRGHQIKKQNCGEIPRNPLAEKFTDGLIFDFCIYIFTYSEWIKYVFRI
jgi:hypothetical protein